MSKSRMTGMTRCLFAIELLVIVIIWQACSQPMPNDQTASTKATRLSSFAAMASPIRLGLHVTQEELNVWRERARSGPYKTSGDASGNSPGDWTRILANANNFAKGNHPGYRLWAGQTTDTCYALAGSGAGPGRSQGDLIRDAAFAYLITGAENYRVAVHIELLAQASTAGTDFSNARRWCTGTADDSDNSFTIANWLTRLLFAYDYIRPSLPEGDQAILDSWFLKAAKYWEIIIDKIARNAFPNRNSDDYSNPSNAGLGRGVKPLYYGGPTMTFWGEHWNNRSASMVRFFTLAAILVNDSTLKNQGKRWFKEWIQYNVFPDGTPGEYYRWLPTYPTLGWSYANMVIGPMVTIADALARAGDRELYDFNTSNGLNGTSGGPKSLHQILLTHFKAVNHTLVRYGTDQSANFGDPKYVIDTIDEVSASHENRNEDTMLVPANVYYADAFIESIYTRTAAGSPPYPAYPSGSGWGVYEGEWGVFPAALFMFGQMEGQVWPYPDGAASGEPQDPPITTDNVAPTVTITSPANEDVIVRSM